MPAVTTQYVRGLLDVKGDIAGIRVVAASKSFGDRSEIERRIAAITAPEEEAIAYLGAVPTGLLFCRFEPYNGVGGRYTQVRAMRVSGVQESSFHLRDLVEQLPRRQFYATVQELDDVTFELPQRIPKWRSDTLQDEHADHIRDLLISLLGGKRMFVETGAAALSKAEARLFDVWSLLPPTLRNTVTFATCREASSRPEAPQIQFLQSRYSTSADAIWIRSTDAPPAAATVADGLVELSKRNVDLIAPHREIDQTLRLLPSGSPREQRLEKAAAIVREWRAWASLELNAFAETELRRYLESGADSRVRRVASAIEAGEREVVGRIISGLAPDQMYAVGMAIAKSLAFNDNLVQGLDASLADSGIDAGQLWRGMIRESADSIDPLKVLTIERVWRSFGPDLPKISPNALFSGTRFDHDCEEVDDHGWWRWISQKNVGEMGWFRGHVLRCKLPLRWAYFAALGEFTEEERSALEGEASSASFADAVAEFAEQWLESTSLIAPPRLARFAPLFVLALRNSMRDHPQVACRLLDVRLNQEDLETIRTIVEHSNDRGALVTLQFRDALAQMVAALHALQDVRDAKDVDVAARLVPRDPALLPFLTLQAMSTPGLEPTLLEILAAAQSDLRGRLEDSSVELLNAHMRFVSAEQALAYAWLAEWLTRRPGVATEILAHPSLRRERERVSSLLAQMTEKLPVLEDRPPAKHSNFWRLIAWVQGDP